jgi:hypothetical protein
MAKIYCPHCGCKNTYTLKKPSLCRSCNKPLSLFSKGSASAPAPLPRTTTDLHDDGFDEDPDSSDSVSVPKIGSLEYEVEYTDANVYKGSDILNVSEEDLKNVKKKPRGPKKRKTNLRRK